MCVSVCVHTYMCACVCSCAHVACMYILIGFQLCVCACIVVHVPQHSASHTVTVLQLVPQPSLSLLDWATFSLPHCPFTCAALQEMMEWHRPRIKCLVEEGVDVLAIETIAAKVNTHF